MFLKKDKSNIFSRSIDRLRKFGVKVGLLTKLKQERAKDNKKVLVDYQEVFNKEKSQRAGLKSNITAPDSNKTESDLPDEDSHKENLEPKKTNVQVEKGKSPGVLKTSLIESEIITFFDWQKSITILLLFIILGVLLVGGMYGYLLVWEKYKKQESSYIIEGYTELQEQVKQMQGEIKAISSLKKKLKPAALLLDRHIYWTNFFQFLEKYTLADVYYKSFNGNINGLFDLPANGKNFYIIAEQVKTFKASELVEHIEVQGGKSSAGERELGGGVDFQLNLEIKPALFTDYLDLAVIK